jgi:hypothetical protein
MIGLIELTRYPHLYKFNKALNIKSYIRNIGGKAVRVTSHRRQAIMRAHEAADDLLAQTDSLSREYGYLLSPSGRLSKRFSGEGSSISMPQSRAISFDLHNHPRGLLEGDSGLQTMPSWGDLELTRGFNQGAIVTPTKVGSYRARYYIKNPKENLNNLREEMDNDIDTRMFIGALRASSRYEIEDDILTDSYFAAANREFLRKSNKIHYREYGAPGKYIIELDNENLYGNNPYLQQIANNQDTKIPKEVANELLAKIDSLGDTIISELRFLFDREPRRGLKDEITKRIKSSQ